MFERIEFDSIQAMLLDFVDQGDGFLYLRMVGEEPSVNAIWARLSARETRTKKYSSHVTIPTSDQTGTVYVAAQKARYKTLRTRLPSGLIDLMMVHPRLTVAEDSYKGFYLLTYDTGTPVHFFDRLNRTLSIPLQPDWADWLWTVGQQEQSFSTIIKRTVKEGGIEVEKSLFEEVARLPIKPLDRMGSAQVYSVRTAEYYRDAWLQIIRTELDVATRLDGNADLGWRSNDEWSVCQTGEQWQLRQFTETVLTATALPQLLTQADVEFGLHLSLEDQNGDSSWHS